MPFRDQGHAALARFGAQHRALRNDRFSVFDRLKFKLLDGMVIEWASSSECEDRLAVGDYPAIVADPKRPYGDYTYIEIDMARILGVLPPPPQRDTAAVFDPEPALAAHLQELHWQMLGAIQAFVENAEIARVAR